MRQADGQTVAAVVVTYNRKKLLDECLQALLRQTRSLDRIIVIDNASTDGTPEFLAQKGYFSNPIIDYVRLPENTGGAGGFHEGIKHGYKGGFSFLWLMDDDTIAQEKALAELITTYERFDPDHRPLLLASKVTWNDGCIHPMNIPGIKVEDVERLFLAVSHSTLSLRSSSFVSVLLHRSLIEKFGLPLAKYFIWNDDVEYTARILRHEFGVLVPTSVVVHKTREKYTPLRANDPRSYYEVRNKIWMITRSVAWTNKERIKLTFAFIRSLAKFLVRSRFSLTTIRSILWGILHGLFTSPK